MQAKGLKINISKTKVVVSGKNCGDVEKTRMWPCAVHDKGVRINSVQKIGCGRRANKCCSGMKGSLHGIGDVYLCNVSEKVGDGESISTYRKTWIWEMVCI